VQCIENYESIENLDLTSPMNEWINWIIGTAALAWGLFGIWAAAHALMNKRDPRSALGWSAVCLLLPYAGPLVYLLFGINRIGQHARRLGHLPAFKHPSPANESRKSQVNADSPSPASRFINISDQVTNRPLMSGNHIQPFFSGDDAYAEMLADIKRANRSIMLATYIFRTDTTGTQFISDLTDAASRRVEVWVLIDGVGDWYSIPRASKKLSKVRVPNARFIPISLIPPSLHLNLRNHRKILIVDGAVGYTGGMNIGNHHVRDKHGNTAVADMHFRLTGPVVKQLEQVFIEDWHFSTGDRITKTSPPSNEIDSASTWARVISDGPDDDLDKLSLVIEAAISAAQRSVRIMTPYFLPTREMSAALKSAALRGVKVDIVLPAKSNLRYVDWATRNLLWELLKWSVNVYYQPPPFAHTKLFIVDGDYLHIGSANIDPRSLRLNFEIAVEVIDAALGETLTRHFDEIVSRSRQISLAEVDERSYPVRLRDSIAWLFSPYL
jgi:cardiolipin synthase